MPPADEEALLACNAEEGEPIAAQPVVRQRAMSENSIVIVGLLLLVFGLPLALGSQEHFQAKKLAQPVIRFTCDGWQLPSLFWTLFQTTFGLGLCLAAGSVIRAVGLQPVSLLVAGFLLPIAWWQFPGLRLFWTYWRHDGRAVLVVDRAQRTATYYNRAFCLNFALADVKEFTAFYPAPTRAASADYSYAVLTFANGTELVISKLLCEPYVLRTLLPDASATAVRQRYAWLPADTLSRRLFGPFFTK